MSGSNMWLKSKASPLNRSGHSQIQEQDRGGRVAEASLCFSLTLPPARVTLNPWGAGGSGAPEGQREGLRTTPVAGASPQAHGLHSWTQEKNKLINLCEHPSHQSRFMASWAAGPQPAIYLIPARDG